MYSLPDRAGSRVSPAVEAYHTEQARLRARREAAGIAVGVMLASGSKRGPFGVVLKAAQVFSRTAPLWIPLLALIAWAMD